MADSVAHARDQSQALTIEDTVAYATRRGGGRGRPTADWTRLTPGELHIARLVGQGLHH